ncbi:hypothetical protein FRC16_002011 [Serendipita sp. 398]|nr:hypothetical protein FRC16_002011 [Serendipita sp. 398]
MNQVQLITYDGQSIPVDEALLLFSALLKQRMQEAQEKGEDIQVPEASAEVCQKVTEYCKHHRETTPTPARVISSIKGGSTFEFAKWDEEFMASLDQEVLLELIVVAQTWGIQPLLDLGCKTVATMLKGKNPQQIREMFEIENDFTPEEEAAIKKEHEWTD